MKKSLFFLATLFFITSCSKVTLIDVTLNSFSATASKDLDDRVAVTWVTNGFFETYQVLRSYQENGTYIPISGAISTDNFHDMTAEKNTVYYYKVRAFNSLHVPLFTTPNPAEGLAGVVGAISAPTTLKVSVGESVNKVILTWERAKGAVSYNIYRSKSPNFFAGESVLITNIPYLRFEDLYSDYESKTLMAPGDVFYYKIASVDEFEATAVYPNQNATTSGLIGSVFGTQDEGLNFSANPGAYADKIHLTWNHVLGAYRYQIFFSENKNTLGSEVAMVTASDPTATGATYSFDHKPADKTKVYFYTLLLHGSVTNVSQALDEKVKGYYKSDSAPAQPANFTVSQGEDVRYIRLSWDPVPGATGYQVSRSINGTSGWADIDLTISSNTGATRILANDDPYTENGDASFSYYYKVVALNPAPGTETSPKQGWANKAPVNITASKSYGGRVLVEWDSVPNAASYSIEYSSSSSGPFILAGQIKPGSTTRQQYSHVIDISPDQTRKLYYRLSVTSSAGVTSDPSTPVEGAISKIQAPQNVQIVNNKTASEQFLRLSWDSVPNAQGYRIYRATLMHRHATIANLKNSDFVAIADVGSRAYIDSLAKLPIRRYQYKIVAIDLDGDEGAATLSEEAYRLPISVKEFLQDVDQTVIEAQTRISGFGNNGSSGYPMARATGQYFYEAGTSAKSQWANYTSFEISLTGNPSFSINISTMSASQTGTVTVSGLYSGSVTYNALVGALGGYTTGGSITARYGSSSVTYGSAEAAGFLESVRSTTESAPRYPSYEKGGGGTIQSGGREQ